MNDPKTEVQVTQPTMIEEATNHLRESNAQLLTQVDKLREFLKSVTGQGLASPPESEKPLSSVSGRLGNLQEDLDAQTRLIDDLKEVTRAIEKIG